MITIPRALPALPDPSTITIASPVEGAQVVSTAFRQIHLWGWRARRAAHAQADWRLSGSGPATYQSPKVSDPVAVVWRAHPRTEHVQVIARVAVNDTPATLTATLYSAPMPAIGAAAVWTLMDTAPAWTTVGGHLIANRFPVSLVDWAYAPVVISTGDNPRPTGGTEPRPLIVSAPTGPLRRLVLTPVGCRVVQVDALEICPVQTAP